MRFSCEKAILQTAVTTAGRVVAAKSSIQALEGILVEAGPGGLSLSGYNLETGIVTTVPADVSKDGAIVLSARLFGEILRRMPDDVVSITTEGFSVHIQCGPTSYDILGSSDEDFPDLPRVEDGTGLTIAQGVLRSMIGQTIFAVSDNESRPIHTGALFEAVGGELTMVAVDGYRLALRREGLLSQEGSGGLSFVVPGAALKEVEKICADCDELAVFNVEINPDYEGDDYDFGAIVAPGVNLNEATKTYSITAPQGLQWLSSQSAGKGNAFSGYTVKLANDIDMAGQEFTPIAKKGRNKKGRKSLS